jgi:hypothetical protein
MAAENEAGRAQGRWIVIRDDARRVVTDAGFRNAWRYVGANLTELQRDPLAADRAVYVLRRELKRERGRMVRRRTVVDRLLRKIESAPHEQKLSLYGAFAGALVASIADRLRWTPGELDREQLMRCLTHWQTQMNIERIAEGFGSWRGTVRQSRKPRTELERHHQRGHALKRKGLGASAIARQIEAECDAAGRSCIHECIRPQLYYPGGPFHHERP